MSGKRLIFGAAAAGMTAVALLLGGVLARLLLEREPRRARTARLAPQSTAEVVAKAQADVRANPYDVTALDKLGLAYQQSARETGDPTYYTKSGEALRRALQLAPHDLIATSGLGSLALSRHRFREALALGRRAQAISPTTARNYGVIGDALVELGRYRDGFRAFDAMASAKPDVSSYSRIGHARYLIGDVPGAIDALKLAADAAEGQGETEAWTHVQLSKVYFSVGRVSDAAAQARAALRAFPDYALALRRARVGAVRAGRRRAPRSRPSARPSNRIPLPQYVAMLGDLYRVSGQPRQARRQYALIGVIERLLVANGVKTDLETALFDVDHGIRLHASLALARLAQRERPSIDGDDVLAWALERNGRCGEALQLLEARAPARDARRAQALPPRDDRALPRQPRGVADVVPARARA